ncbi:hypothetical protein [Tropicibacter sp. S64]|uniref:hypothetical protein n=1 Tax=Tropicibacter sp. S64 TaxID=3415122 RepID=UPI003C7C84BC
MFKTFLSGLIISAALTTGASALDASKYQSLVAQTIAGLSADTVDVAQLMAFQQDLVDMGVEGARAYAVEAPEHAELMNFVADHAPEMIAMSLDAIEYAWHDGEALEEIGVSPDDLDHFGPVVSHMDAIIHPATAMIALREFEATGNRAHLVQVKDELSEVVAHLSHLN